MQAQAAEVLGANLVRDEGLMKSSDAKCLFALVVLLYIQDSNAMRMMDYLEQYDIGELTYAGINSYSCDFRSTVSGSVMDPGGFPHAVRRGTYIGRDFGVISRMDAGSIEIRELLQNADGEWIERTVVLPRVKASRPTHYGYQQRAALYAIGKRDAPGKQMEQNLLLCRGLYGQDTERLACFDAAVGSVF
jgi:hypothetical protein